MQLPKKVFWSGFSQTSYKLKTECCIYLWVTLLIVAQLKLKDWPTSQDFREKLPSSYQSRGLNNSNILWQAPGSCHLKRHTKNTRRNSQLSRLDSPKPVSGILLTWICLIKSLNARVATMKMWGFCSAFTEQATCASAPSAKIPSSSQ